MRKKRYLLSMLGIASVVVPCMSMATTLESNETLPTVGHKPTLEMGLRINGGPNLLTMDLSSNGIVDLSSSITKLKVGDRLEFHGIYSDIDGDIESSIFRTDNTMTLTASCLGTGPSFGSHTLMSEEFGKKRSKTQWSHSFRLTSSEVGCSIQFSKTLPESDKVQSSSDGASYTPVPLEGNRNAYFIILGKVER
ncbi:hypothetical protein E1344_24190 [Salmonella enterica subsp. enterica serovar Bareilly]|nr:hypothetical protein [Salmonella enterica subsp. enterica serovar Bareilly]